MSASEWVGTVGVTILLTAFALNVGNKITSNSSSYLLMNFVGALLAGVSAYLIEFWPFVILEGVWAISSFILLINLKKHE